MTKAADKLDFPGLLKAISQNDIGEKKSPELSTVELNKAALLLIEALHDGIKANVQYNMDTSGAEPWQYICGLIVHCAESATLSCSIVDRSWMGTSPIFSGLVKCTECSKEFKPRKRGEVFCSDECARIGTTLKSSNPDWRPRPKIVHPQAQLGTDLKSLTNANDGPLEAIEL